MGAPRFPVMLLLIACASTALAQNLVVNGGFEKLYPIGLDAAGKSSGWTLGDPPRLPEKWTLNSTYTGHFEIGTEGAHGGETFVRLTSPEKGTAHLYSMLEGLRSEKWYRVTLWVRGGPFNAHFYEYFQNAPIGGQTIMAGEASGGWRQFSALYMPVGDGYLRSALAVYPSPGHWVEVDDVSVEPVDLPEGEQGGADVTFETKTFRLTLTPNCLLKEFTDLASGEQYAGSLPVPVFQVVRSGATIPARTVRAEGNRLEIGFIDPDIRASVDVSVRDHHLLFTVVSVEPESVAQFEIQFPLKRLEKVGFALNGTFDDRFGACMFGTTVNTFNQPQARSSQVYSPRSICTQEHGMVGTGFALAAAPREAFFDAIMEAQRENDLPCPMLDGQWNRVSDAARKSYLFATGVVMDDIDTLIEYAKVGGFGTIIFLKDSWLANHGHFDINTKSFPRGLEDVKEAVRRIHAAGLDAGVHVFGPSISPGDPYITPIPDPRLASVKCPPLAEALDETATTIALTEAPPLPPNGPKSMAFPGFSIQIGNEIIQYTEQVEAGIPYRMLNCRRGAFGTKATSHPAGAEVKGLLSMWGFFLVDPDSTLAEEVTGNFARVFNECNFDFVYFDASDGIIEPYIDRWYYLNKLHKGYWDGIGRDVLYQTSNGTGSNFTWHIVPRSASADGHGDIKGYLDDRWPGILGMESNLTKADIGWYYWFRDCRPDQIEYVCAKALGVDGSISVETSREAMDRLTQTRQLWETIGRWERCRAERHFGEAVRAKFREPQKDFRLFGKGEGDWIVYRAAYEEPRLLDMLDGLGNVWTIHNDLDTPCDLGVELVLGVRPRGTGVDYQHENAVTIEAFDDAESFRMSEWNAFEKFVQGGEKKLTETGPVRADVTQSFAVVPDARPGSAALKYDATNSGGPGGWGGIGKRFETPVDLSGFEGIGLWVNGDANQETLRIQFRDTAGRNLDFTPVVNFKGWRVLVFELPKTGPFDLTKVEYLVLYFNNLSPNSSASVMFDELRGLPELTEPGGLVNPILRVNGRDVVLPVSLNQGQAFTVAGPDGATLWPGGMAPGEKVAVDTDALRLAPGENRVELALPDGQTFPGDLQVLLYRLWPMEAVE